MDFYAQAFEAGSGSGSGGASGSGSGGASGSGSGDTPLIHKLFVWPHGGRDVYLSGTFSRWTEFMRMKHMEGCPSVFQLVCSLTPGTYQYKFIVDGEWKHDENQPFVTGDIGIVNVINVAAEPEILPAVLTAETPGLSHMEVDNGVFGNVEANPSLPVSEVDISRYRISRFLSSQSAYELFPDSGKAVALDASLPVKLAFDALYEEGTFVAPVWDSRRQRFVGMLTPIDFILLIKQVEIHGSNMTQGQLERYTIGAWREAKVKESGPSTGQYPQHFVSGTPSETLDAVALKMVQNKVATVPILRSSENGLFPQLLHVASLTGILKCICRHFKNCSDTLPILHLPIGSMPLGTWISKTGKSTQPPLAMLRPSASVSDAMSLLIHADVSSIVIVDDNGAYIDVYSRRDVIGLVKDAIYVRVNLNWVSLHQALLLRRDIHYPRELRHGPRCHMCFKSDPLHKVMARMVNPGIKQLVVVEPGSKVVEGIISIGDVFRFFLN